jgi:two-component system phosphate regulon response regulator PhoB
MRRRKGCATEDEVARVFLIEDNESIREAVAGYLRLAEHEVVAFDSVRDVREVMEHKRPDLLIIDVMLPDGNGFAFAKQVRAHSTVPFIFLTAKDAESDRITGFELGADDYVVKPFSPKELVLRAEAVLRRTKATGAEPRETRWSLDGKTLSVDEDKHTAAVDEGELQLTGAEWKILEYLAKNEGIMLSRERILGECLDYDYEGSERTVDTHIKNIRAKLGDGNWIETVRGFGYRFKGEKERT